MKRRFEFTYQGQSYLAAYRVTDYYNTSVYTIEPDQKGLPYPFADRLDLEYNQSNDTFLWSSWESRERKFLYLAIVEGIKATRINEVY